MAVENGTFLKYIFIVNSVSTLWLCFTAKLIREGFCTALAVMKRMKRKTGEHQGKPGRWNITRSDPNNQAAGERQYKARRRFNVFLWTRQRITQGLDSGFLRRRGKNTGRPWDRGTVQECRGNRGRTAVGTDEWQETGIRTGAGELVRTGRLLRENARKQNKQFD